jgi:Tol biopolymer transport system component
MIQKKDTGWSTTERISDNVNSKDGDWHPAVAKNGDIYFASIREGGFGKGDIYFAQFIDGHYQKSENMGIEINTKYNERDPYISPNGEYMLFKSDRPGGYGHMDMYVSFKKDNKWTTPKNLGPKLNTQYMDDTGDVNPDGKYLIFARRNYWEFMDIYWI